MLLQTELDHLRIELQKLTAHKQKLLQQLPALCGLSASLQDTHILQQDYNAKLARQQYCIAKKQAFLKLLIDQHARQQLLCAVRDAEVQQLQSLIQELQLLLDALTGVKTASQHRIASYTSQQLQDCAGLRQVVPNSDSFLQTLDRLLPDGDNDSVPSSSSSSSAKLYVTIEQLQSKLGKLSSQGTAGTARQAEHDHKQIAASFQAAFSTLHAHVFPDVSSDATQLTAPGLDKALSRAQHASTDLTEVVQKVTQQQHMYQHLLSQQQVQLEAERQVFSRFHSYPETLQELCLSL